MEDRKEWKTGEKSDIEIRNLSVSFQDGGETVHAMEGVNAYFPAGSVTGLIGESGSGKSLLGMSILGLLSGQAKVEGTCMYKGMDLYRLPEKEMQEIRGKEISLIPQNPTESLNPIRRIGKQLTECMTVHGNKDKELANSRRDEFLRRFGFADPDRISRAYSFQLSGGMNQRVISAMGLMNRPKWAIADEPTKGLDAILRRQVYQVLKEISETDTEGMIVITHDIALAGVLCDRLMVLYYGGRGHEDDPGTSGSPVHERTGRVASGERDEPHRARGEKERRKLRLQFLSAMSVCGGRLQKRAGPGSGASGWTESEVCPVCLRSAISARHLRAESSGRPVWMR